MKNAARILLFVVLLPLAMLLVIIIHEFGHVAVARLFGDQQTSYYVYRRYPEGGFCLGCYTSGVLSETGTTFVKIGGVILTQLCFLALVAALGTKLVNFISRGPFVVLAGLFFMDLPFQILQGFRPAPQAPKSGIDMADFSQLVALQADVSALAIKIVLVVAFAIYLLALLWLYRTRIEKRKTLPESGSPT